MKRAPDLLLTVRRDASVDPALRAAAEGELGRCLDETKTLLFRGDIRGGGRVLLQGLREHLRRVPHADPHDQARALRGLARQWELSCPAEAIDMYRDALALNPRIRDVQNRLKKLEARVAGGAPVAPPWSPVDAPPLT